MSTSLEEVVAQLTALPRESARVPAQPTPARRPKPGPRALPVRNPEFDSYDLHALRAHRGDLTAAESRVSYWRRILQARLDLVRSGMGPIPGDGAHLRPVLAEARAGLSRSALLETDGAADDAAPDLVALWDRRVDPDDADAVAELEADLASAEKQLSAYRAGLHERLSLVTGELIARYREDPSLCLVALPLPPERSAG